MFIRPDFKKFKIFGHKNPEYRINGLVADCKGIMSEKGVTAAFKSAIKQGCECVVIDLDVNMADKPMQIGQLAKYLFWRKEDFYTDTIKKCYVIYHNRVAEITKEGFDKERIIEILKKISRA